MEKTLYEVNIAGTPFKMRSSHDQATVDELVALVNEKVDQAATSGRQVSFQNALLLASLHIAEDLVMTRRQTFSALDQLESRTEKVLQGLESSPPSQISADC